MTLLAALLLAGLVEASPKTYEIALEEALIPMHDGVSLAADLWRPKGARAGARFPVVLEYLPYRKDEERASYQSLYSYLARRGYVVARVDIRGTGRSEGVLLPYEYSEIEHRDGDDVIAWLARQPFSNGNVGMIGISWSGFNAIQMAMRAAYETTLRLGERVLRFENEVEIVGDRANFNYACVKRLFENGALVREKRWAEAIRRDFQ